MYQLFTGPLAGLLILGLQADEEKHLSTPRFTIPVALAPEHQASLKELLLFVSTNRGKSWDLHSRIKPGQDGFPFVASGDGVYWFSVAVIDSKGNMEPRDIYKARIDQKIIVDTRKPDLVLEAEQRGSNTHLNWVATDDHADLASMKMELLLDGSDQPIPIHITPNLKGSGHFSLPPNSTGSVRLTIQDKAGNQTITVREFAKTSRPLVSGSIDPSAAGSTPPFSPVALARNDQPVPIQPPPPDPPSPSGSNMIPPPLPTAPVSVPVIQPGVTQLPAGVSPPFIEASRAVPSNSNSLPAQSVTNGPSTLTPSGSAGGSMPNRANLPAVQVVSKRPVKADIEITKLGPSGIGSIEIWATHDDGMNWILAGTETPQANMAPGQRFSVNLPVAQEGLIHGFILIVKSKAGLGRQPPQRGDSPSIRVELDSTFPEATLFSPQPDPSRKDGLILTWKANDRNLTSQPVILEWSENRDGPWQNIAGMDLPNTGRYLWQVPAMAPPAVFLRLSVKDMAGNIAVAQTQDPLLVDLNVPEFQVIGIQGRQ